MSSVPFSDRISVGWLIENKIIRVQIGGALEQHTAEVSPNADYDPLVVQLLDQASGPVHVVVHVQANSNTAYPSVSRLLSFKYPRHPRTGYIVVVNQANSPIVRFLMSILGSVSGVKIKGVNHLDDALKFLQTLESRT